MSANFIIIDGHSLLYRAFHALPLFQTTGGLYTNAVYGFANMLIRILEDFSPEYLAVALDEGRVTFRNEIYQGYKATRKPTPAELSAQIPMAEELLAAWGIETIKARGYEADDIMGTLAGLAAASNLETLIVTSDRDLLQLVGGRVKVLLPNKGASDVLVMDEAGVREKYGIEPKQIIDLKSLMGDKSDNIPGVPGVGEKTAVKLLQEFGSLENILKNIDSINGTKVRNLLRENSSQAILSQKLATIFTDMPLEFSPEKFSFAPNRQAVREIFQKLEFKSLLGKLNYIFKENSGLQPEKSGGEISHDRPELPAVKTVFAAGAVKKMHAAAKKISCFPLVGGGPPLVALEAIAFTSGGETLFIPQNSPAWPEVLAVLADEKVEKITHDAKLLWNACQNQNVALQNLSFDTMLAAYLLEPAVMQYSLPSLATAYNGDEGRTDFALVEPKDYAGWASAVIYTLEPVLKKRLDEAGLAKLFQDVEMPLIEVLSAMEFHGVKVDKDRLRTMSGEIATRLSGIITRIYELAGEHFNLNSPKQLGFILFDKLELPKMKKTKTGYSTDAEVLEKLAGAHPIVDLLLEYRMLAKLKSTYLDGLEPLVREETGRIHTTFNQMSTVTGRLSSSEPNLQNIPVRSEEGKKIRELFVMDEGFSCLMSADYSQIELRILAHISNDEKLIEAFNQNQDIHARTAAEVFGVGIGEVTAAMRSKAKAVNFGIVYGISDYGLARDLNVSRKEAGEYIDNYFVKYQGVKNYIDDVIATAKKDGYVTTIFGRRRFLPDINSPNFNKRSFAERTAMNTPVQGAAADIIKMAMIKMHRSLKESGLKSRLILQVHDELVLEIFRGEEEKIGKMVKDIMEKIVGLKIPLAVDIAKAENWAGAK